MHDENYSAVILPDCTGTTLILVNKDVSQEQVMAQRCLTFGLNTLKADNQG